MSVIQGVVGRVQGTERLVGKRARVDLVGAAGEGGDVPGGGLCARRFVLVRARVSGGTRRQSHIACA